MTIAICYLTPEGVVLGADSTATFSYGPDHTHAHYLQHQQKVFEVGKSATLGVAHWGLSNFGDKSIRTIVAELADELAARGFESVEQAAHLLAETAWREYSHVVERHKGEVKAFQDLVAFRKQRQSERRELATSDEERLSRLTLVMRDLRSGFFLAGHAPRDRTPRAFNLSFDPILGLTPPRPIDLGYEIAGEDFVALRILEGIDRQLKSVFEQSTLAAGIQTVGASLLKESQLRLNILPIREAADFAYSIIHATIKAIKFSERRQTCGGPIEIAVVTTDRPFRWIRHKTFESAIVDGEPQ